MDYKPLLEKLLEQTKLSKKKFAESIGVSQGNVSDWFNKPNARPSIDALKRISDTHNINLNWLVTGTGDMYNNVRARVGDRELVDIPIIPDIAAGAPICVDDVEPAMHLKVLKEYLPFPGPYYGFSVSGDSMEPEIYQGDIAILSGSTWDIDLDGRICGFRTSDGIILKRLTLDHRHKCGQLYSLNHRRHKPIHYYKDTEDLNLFGHLILVIRKYN